MVLRVERAKQLFSTQFVDVRELEVGAVIKFNAYAHLAQSIKSLAQVEAIAKTRCSGHDHAAEE